MLKTQKKYSIILQNQAKKKSLPFSIDGLVIKIDSLMMKKLQGLPSRVPRWGRAYKFPAVQPLITFNEIKYTDGRIGKTTFIPEVVEVLLDRRDYILP